MLHLLKKSATINAFITLYGLTFIIRAALFLCYIQPYEYYKQSDSTDYHYGAMSIALNNGMYKLDTNQPIFWRTPGYPLYLSYFYSFFGIQSFNFEHNKSALIASIWVQIILSSFIPIILFFLAYLLTNSYPIAWLTAWATALHVGIALAPAYILTEGLALIFFYIFLYFFYQQFFGYHKKWVGSIILAVAALSIYTWMRPMGEFVGIFSAIFLALLGKDSWQLNCKKGLLFIILFFSSLFPWYIRNYQLTNEWFFCPTLGLYLNVFSAPKIISRIHNISLENAWKLTSQAAGIETRKVYTALRGTGKYVSPSIAKKISFPICRSYPFYFCCDWLQECAKTTFDLYTYQLAAMAANTFYYDPLQEFLTEKVAFCLWNKSTPIATRTIGWLELVWSLLLWIGLCGGFCLFLLRPLWKSISIQEQNTRWLWLHAGLMIGLVICMTGGFGYARLRLPVEPLMIILSLTFWLQIFTRKKS